MRDPEIVPTYIAFTRVAVAAASRGRFLKRCFEKSGLGFLVRSDLHASPVLCD